MTTEDVLSQIMATTGAIVATVSRRVSAKVWAVNLRFADGSMVRLVDVSGATAQLIARVH